jgi:hypothetical protein
MMKKMTTASLLLALLLATALPLRSQTRPRRVTQMTAAPARETIPRRRGRNLMNVLLGLGIALGSQMDRSCTPSRDAIGERARRVLF